MMSPRRRPNRLFSASTGCAAIGCVAGLCLLLLPVDTADTVRSCFCDLARPGQRLVRTAIEPLSESLREFGEWRTQREQLESLKSRLRASERHCRQLRARHAQLQMEHPPAAENASTASLPLLLPEVIEARLLGSETVSLWRGRKLLAAGQRQGLKESLLVVDGDNPLIDQGGTAEVNVNDAVYCGRIVVGRISKVGAWTSTLESVSSAKFRGVACILRETADGWVAGGQGIITGDGERGCRMEVEAAETVQVGDAVYSVPEDGVLSAHMYYGTVTRVDWKPGSLNLQLKIEPAANEISLKTVSVRRTKLNSARILAN